MQIEYILNINPIGLFKKVEIDKLFLKFIWKVKALRIVKIMLWKKERAKLENVHYLILRLTYYNAKLTKTLWYWYKNRQ